MGGVESHSRATADHNGVRPAVTVGRGPLRHPARSRDPAESPLGPAGVRVAVVSGGNRGLGLRIVQLLAGQGMRVVLGSRSVDNGRSAVGLLGDLANRVAVRQLDITDAASVAELARWLRERLGRCDVLVNNASVLIDDDRTDGAGVDLEVVRRTLETNLLGTWRLTQAIVPIMRVRGYGRIVNVSSGTGCLATTRHGLTAYRISKYAVNWLTRTLADELGPYGILVNACCPMGTRIEARDPRDPVAVLADTPVRLALLPDDAPAGRFYCACESVD